MLCRHRYLKSLIDTLDVRCRRNYVLISSVSFLEPVVESMILDLVRYRQALVRTLYLKLSCLIKQTLIYHSVVPENKHPRSPIHTEGIVLCPLASTEGIFIT